MKKKNQYYTVCIDLSLVTIKTLNWVESPSTSIVYYILLF